MFVVNSYSLAVIFCFITMLCWGSWGNTQKLAGKTWRYELFYWDYVIGMVLFAILLGFTMGSIGTEGRPFLEDLAQAEWGGIGSVVLGGVTVQQFIPYTFLPMLCPIIALIHNFTGIGLYHKNDEIKYRPLWRRK